MSSPAARVRAELQARTGVDFATYADDEFIDAVTGWSGLLALGKELAVAGAIGVGVLATAVIWALAGDHGFDTSVGLILGGLVAGVGAGLTYFAIRVRRRAPEEASKVFDVAGEMADRVAADIADGRLEISASDAARGVAIAAAIPALTRAAQRRFPLAGLLIAPALGSIISRTLFRVWPSGGAPTPLSGLERPARGIEQALESVRAAVIPKLSRAVRWASLPFIAAGAVLVVMGAFIALISLSVA
jgi:hypothetical protein